MSLPETPLSFIYPILIFLTALSSCSTETCVKVANSDCSCSNSRGVIDLKPLDTGNKPIFTVQDKSGSDTYDYTFNPCSPYTLTSSTGCSQVLGCQNSASIAYPLASVKSMVVQGAVENKTLTFLYDANSNDGHRYMHVLLECTDADTEFLFLGENPQLHYKFKLKSVYACYTSNSLSIGSILLIVLLVLVIVYIVAGVLILTFWKKEEGVKRIPNVTFWTDFPRLVKDGTMFVVGKVRGRSAYNEI
ncbi:cation-dependent mannose-6-phosphate receptor-like [Tubulanus polymorphus]|uniref:cation-dependent mannose-6-phosphate receptor-like n=1 Tax=Tubulanus polymorphus TaxID=672921 RepID=UPI003DA514C1